MLRRLLAGSLTLAVLLVPVGFATKKPPSQPVNVNTASSAQLQLVPGIGPVTAEKILQMRKSYGAFKSVDDLMAIRGIGPKRLEKMKKYLTVGKSAPANNAKPASCSGCASQKPRPPAKSSAETSTKPASPGAPAQPVAETTEEP
jgi:competence protein ComEA